MNRISMHEGELWPQVGLAMRTVTQSMLVSQRVPGSLHYWPPLSKQKRGGGGVGGKPATWSPCKARMGNRWKGAGEDAPRAQEAGHRLPPATASRLGQPALGDCYLVQVRVPGDIVSSLLQGHRAPRARLGVAASGCCRERPARGGAAGPAAQERQPRAGAQRGAHAPCADLVPGRNQGQRRLPAGQALRVPQGAEPEWRHVLGARAGVPKGLVGGHLSGALRLRCAGLARRPAERKPAQDADAGDSRATPARTPGQRRLRGQDAPRPHARSLACLGPVLAEPTCAAPGGDVFAAPLRGRRGEALRAGVPRLPMAAPRRRPREREAGAFCKERSPRNIRWQCGASAEDARGAPRNRVRVPPQRPKGAQRGPRAPPSRPAERTERV